MTARDDFRAVFGLAMALANRPVSEVDELLDEYEAAHRAEVLREAADHFRRHCLAHNPDAHHGYIQCHCAAADELLSLAKEAPDA